MPTTSLERVVRVGARRVPATALDPSVRVEISRAWARREEALHQSLAALAAGDRATAAAWRGALHHAKADLWGLLSPWGIARRAARS